MSIMLRPNKLKKLSHNYEHLLSDIPTQKNVSSALVVDESDTFTIKRCISSLVDSRTDGHTTSSDTSATVNNVIQNFKLRH